MRKGKESRHLLLAALIAVGFILRVTALSTRGIWYDDAFSFFLAQRDPTAIIAGTAADTMPPLYYFALHLWMILGTAVVTLRLLNVLVSISIVFLTFKLANLLFDTRVAATATLLTVASPFHIYHAQELRMYGFLCLNLLLYLLFFSRIYLKRVDHAWLDWIGLTTAGALAMYSHNLAAFTLLSADLLLLAKRRWRLLGHLMLAQGGILLLASPWLVMVPGQIAKVQRAFWTPRPGLLEVVQALITFHTDLPLPRWMLGIAVAVTVLFLTVVCYNLLRKRRQDPRVQLLAAFTCLPPMLLFALSYAMRPLFVPRGFILSSVAYYILAAVVLVDHAPRLVHSTLLVSFVAAALLALPSTYTFGEFPRSPFRAAVGFLQTEIRSGDVVLHDNKLSYLPMHYYGRDLPQVFLPDEPGSHNDTLAPATQDAMMIWPIKGLQQVAEDTPRLWFVFFARTAKEWEERRGQHPVLEKLKRKRQVVDRATFNDLKIMLFERQHDSVGR